MENEKKGEREPYECPLGRLFQDIERVAGRKSGFFEHLTRSKMEFLKALRSLVDDRIQELEERVVPGKEKKTTKIEVE